jgi:hypothetical protein
MSLKGDACTAGQPSSLCNEKDHDEQNDSSDCSSSDSHSHSLAAHRYENFLSTYSPYVIARSWMNRVSSWWRGGSSEGSDNHQHQRVLLQCGSSSDVLSDTSLAFCGGGVGSDETAAATILLVDTASVAKGSSTSRDKAAWNQAVAVLLKRPEFTVDATTAALEGRSAFTSIPHVKQLETWDCGVACLQMIWQWLCQESSNLIANNDKSETNVAATAVDRAWMLEQLQTQSVWTVDIVLLLDRLIRSQIRSQEQQQQSASYLFCSKTLGVNETLQDVRYYRAAFGVDQGRVQDLFGEIERRNLPVLQVASLQLEQIVAVIQLPDSIAIALVDNFVLLGGSNKAPPIVRQSAEDDASFSRNDPDGDDTSGVLDTYAGHYIILQGTSCEPNHLLQAGVVDDEYCFVVQNPGACVETTYLSPELFERAWRAKGTDEDIIFVTRH